MHSDEHLVRYNLANAQKSDATGPRETVESNVVVIVNGRIAQTQKSLDFDSIRCPSLPSSIYFRLIKFIKNYNKQENFGNLGGVLDTP